MLVLAISAFSVLQSECDWGADQIHKPTMVFPLIILAIISLPKGQYNRNLVFKGEHQTRLNRETKNFSQDYFS